MLGARYKFVDFGMSTLESVNFEIVPGPTTLMTQIDSDRGRGLGYQVMTKKGGSRDGDVADGASRAAHEDRRECLLLEDVVARRACTGDSKG